MTLVPMSLDQVRTATRSALPAGWEVIRCQPIHRTPRRSGSCHELGAFETLLVTLQYQHDNHEVTTVEIQADRLENLVEAVGMLPRWGLTAGIRLEAHRDYIDPRGRVRRRML